MIDYTSKAFLLRSGFRCDRCDQVSAADLASGGSLVLLRLDGFSHLYVDEPFDAHVLFASGRDINFGVEWFAVDELNEAEDAFKARLEKNPYKAHRGTVAHEIGSAVKTSSEPYAVPSIRP